jgi:hypothetical protein
MYLFIRIVFYKLLYDKPYFHAVFVTKTISTSTWDSTPDRIYGNKKKNSWQLLILYLFRPKLTVFRRLLIITMLESTVTLLSYMYKTYTR